MTFEKLKELIEKHNIPKNVKLLRYSGWEIDGTGMDGAFYNDEENHIIFTHDYDNYKHIFNRKYRILS